jgi:hypothetical protein
MMLEQELSAFAALMGHGWVLFHAFLFVFPLPSLKGIKGYGAVGLVHMGFISPLSLYFCYV